MTDRSFDPLSVLYVGGDERDAERLARGLEAAVPAFDVTTVQSGDEAVEYVRTTHVNCVVSRQQLPGSDDGIALQQTLTDQGIWLPFVLVPDESVDVAARAVEAGVDRYCVWTTVEETVDSLASVIEDAVAESPPQVDLLDRMNDAFVAVDDRWRFTYLNSRGHEILTEALEDDPSISEIRGRSLWETAPGIVGTSFEEHCRAAMESQRQRSFESYYDRIDRWFDVRLFPSPAGLSIYFYEITDRREYEQTLEHREEVLRQIYRIIADTDCTFEAKVERLLDLGRAELGMEYGTLSRVEGTEYTLSVVAGPDHDVIAPGGTVDLAETNCERVVETESHLALPSVAEDAPELTDRLVYELGVESYLGAPIFVDEEVDGTFCFYDFEPRSEPFSQWELTLVDLMGSWVSYERARERQRVALERERDRLDAVAGTLSHDLRNPLTTANLRLELVAEECNSEHLAELETALERIDTLVDDVLSMARLGPDALDLTTVQLDVLANRAWETAGAPEGTLRTADGLGTVVADEGALQQLLENLFANAVEHGAPEDGDLLVRVGPLDEGAGFYVADNGPGIPADEREEIFERGYSTRSDGTGFGLAIVGRIVDAHDAEISVTEAETGGARFEISGLPSR
ncbi:PAS domain-containing protein [Halovenus sp. WSH3]|uniref:histidine kinase n=1 Tax=Halovenus carboxidivorans TaxID=2692199 RepID=A0A6B0T6Q5_9EURY|nr:ATP-binding protein [Halovenus carboxidivorans]MXR50570.1 PAS domain-containing protein [Halovenus carboxidivorans]